MVKEVPPKAPIKDPSHDVHSPETCIPPWHPDAGDEDLRERGGKDLYLVTRGHTVGLFSSWPSAAKSVNNYDGNVHVARPSYAQCLQIWRQACREDAISRHQHPPKPTIIIPDDEPDDIDGDNGDHNRPETATDWDGFSVLSRISDAVPSSRFFTAPEPSTSSEIRGRRRTSVRGGFGNEEGQPAVVECWCCVEIEGEASVDIFINLGLAREALLAAARRGRHGRIRVGPTIHSVTPADYLA
ncbi:hypothetical protein BDZ89DRAFT_1135952 [Hymenopellis radicata]|nr:hypothetical protein BDZ89DRAFT_1135952 [Hymenopellis radicata]